MRMWQVREDRRLPESQQEEEKEPELEARSVWPHSTKAGFLKDR